MCYSKTWTAGYAGLSPKVGDQGFLPATFIGIQRNYSGTVVHPLTAASVQRVYNGHPSTTATSLQWPLSSVPKVAVVELFNCTKRTS